MTRITISVKESKLQQLLDYLNKLDYVSVEDSFELSDEHKRILDEELEYIEKNPDEMVSFEQFKKNAQKHR